MIAPKEVQEQSAKGILLYERFKRGATFIVYDRSKLLAEGKEIPTTQLRRLKVFFDRNLSNSEVGDESGAWDNAVRPSDLYIR